MEPSTQDELWLAKLDDVLSSQPESRTKHFPVPTETAIANARSFLGELLSTGNNPTRLTISAVGGIAITRRNGTRKVMVECLNNSQVHALFADDETHQMHTRNVQPTPLGFRTLLAESDGYLNG